MLLHSNLTLRLRSPRVFCVGAGIALFTCAALFGAVRLNGGAQAAQPELLIPGAQPDSEFQDPKPPVEKEKKPAEGSKVAVKVIRGSVVDQAGKPVAQAKLCLPVKFRPRRAAQATTDHAGQFELNVPDDWLDKEQKYRLSTLWAYAPGYSLASEGVGTVLYGNATELVVKIALPPPEKTSFKILTPSGEPLHDALVQPHHYQTYAGYEYVPEEFLKIIASKTNAEGIATFTMLRQKNLFNMQFISAAFGRQELRVDYPKEAMRTIRLSAMGRIEGRLTAEKPEWVREVRLSISTYNESNEEKLPYETVEVTTDTEGRYVVPAIASSGPVRFGVGIDSKLPVRPRLQDHVYLKAGETLRMDIPLISAPLVYGTILTKSGSKPVPHADIFLSYGHQQQSWVKTNEKGYFETRALPGEVWLQVHLPKDYLLTGPREALTQQVPEGVEKFELTKIEVAEPRDLTGTLVGEKNDPLPDKRVVATYQGGHHASGTTDSEGRFKIKVPEGVETTFEVYSDKTDPQYLPAIAIQKNPLILRYTGQQPDDPERAKKADVTLTGRVLAEGKPLAGVVLTLIRRSKPVPIPDKNNPAGPAKGFSSRTLQTFGTTSDADGRYRLSGLKAGDEYSIDIKAPFPLADLDWRYQNSATKLEDQAKGDIAIPDLNLRKWTQTLAGIVVDPIGKPVSGAHVGVHTQKFQRSIPRLLKTGNPPWTTTDSAGRFHLEQLPDEPLEIFAYIQPANRGGVIRFPATLAVEKNQQNIRVVLDPSLVEEK